MVLDTIIDDRVNEASAGTYAQLTDYWTEWFRSVVGVREDYLYAHDRGTNAGTADSTIFQPKGSLVFTPVDNWEFYVSAGRGFHSNDVRGATSIGSPLFVKSTGKEIGVRTNVFKGLTATVTLFQMEFESELTYDAEAGQTTAGPPSKRTGVEINTTYQVFDWLEVYGSLAMTHARYTGFDPATHIGNYIPDAPSVIGQLGIYVRDAGPWFGALELRYLGQHPLDDTNTVRSQGDQEWNLNIGYNFDNGLKATLGIFNLLDSKDNAAEYYYADRLPGEPAGGVPDLHIHPLEPRAFRLTVSKEF